MATRKFVATVEIEIQVTVDDAKFDEAFMSEFRESFYQFHDLERHVKHLAQIEARGLNTDDFIEGYGPIKDMGIHLKERDWEVTELHEIAA